MKSDIVQWGPVPGVGKTFFARALAAECEVELVLSSYSAMEAQTGGGNLIAKAIKKIFDEARKKAPCILFIDEMDSVGVRQKRAHNSGWFDVVINGLLAELDGANPRDGVVVIGATNFPDNVDPALKRPGRLDRTITIPTPTIADLQGIIAHHIGIDSVVAARAMRGRTPAQIAMDCRDARRRARRERRSPTVDDLVDVVAAGREARDPAREWRMAIHESGHAAWILRQTSERLDHVDLDALYTKSGPVEAGVAAEILASVSSCLAGRAAEQAILGEPGAGAIIDLDQATRLALAFHARMGFGQRGLASYERDASRARALLEELLPQMAATLLLPGAARDLATARQAIPEALAELAKFLRANKLSVVEMEKEFEDQGRPDANTGIRGFIDLLAREENGRQVVIDLKWQRTDKYRRKEIADGVAIQLAIYARQVGDAMADVPTGYFMLRQKRFVTSAQGFSGSVVAVEGESPHETWTMIENFWRAVMTEMAGGSVRAAFAQEDVDQAKFHDPSLMTPPKCNWCDYAARAGAFVV